MAEPVVTPLALKNPLASTPDQDPKWAIEVSLKSGEKVKMVDPRASRAMVSLMDMQAVLGGRPVTSVVLRLLLS